MWDESKDARLKKLKAQGYSFAEVGEAIGVTRNAAIGRYARLTGKYFKSEIERKQKAKLDTLARRAEHEKQRSAQINEIKLALEHGADRGELIQQARENGATFQTVADALGLTRQRIHQIAS
jgi:hypothetical protein